jgi:hypothetical protein
VKDIQYPLRSFFRVLEDCKKLEKEFVALYMELHCYVTRLSHGLSTIGLVIC